MIFYKINPTGIAAEIFGNEVVLMNLYKGNYYCFRGETSVQIWQMLENAVTINQVTALLALAYQRDEAEIQAALETFFTQLVTEQLILVTSPTNLEVVPFASFLPTEPFTLPVLEVYDDMQELILLDPIHDVDPEEGWPTQK